MTDRVLPPSEWHRLEGIDGLGSVWRVLDPAITQIAVVETDEGKIVACWAAVTLVHVEGAWIAPAHRRTVGVTRRLYRRMKAIVNSLGAVTALTGAESPEIRALLDRKSAQPVPQEYLLCL